MDGLSSEVQYNSDTVAGDCYGLRSADKGQQMDILARKKIVELLEESAEAVGHYWIGLKTVCFPSQIKASF